ncbi:hypothetical protein ACFODL_06035 [Phenylobacterium terrae]|uniref:Hemolysin n=1 Tax=Phenylobacterium terrae TaxID=2665495 RepID=A0ABW4N6M4_9CAUL
MIKLIALASAGALLAGCSAVGTAPKLNLVADRPGCSSVARAFMSQDGTSLTADQILNGVAECENRDRLGALQFDPNALAR